jgi:hypothetical protein
MASTVSLVPVVLRSLAVMVSRATMPGRAASVRLGVASAGVGELLVQRG